MIAHFDSEISRVAQEDSKSYPAVEISVCAILRQLRDLLDLQLPEHDKGSSDSVWGHLRRVNGNTSVLHAESDAHDEASGKEPLPGLGASGTDRSSE